VLSHSHEIAGTRAVVSLRSKLVDECETDIMHGQVELLVFGWSRVSASRELVTE
jgi:hypothetical protein